MRQICTPPRGINSSLLVAMLSACIAYPPAAAADDPEESNSPLVMPFCVTYTRIAPDHAFQYLRDMTRDLPVGKSLLVQEGKESASLTAAPQRRSPLRGVALFATAQFPFFKKLDFVEVDGQEGARLRAEDRRTQWGANSHLEDRGDGSFRVWNKRVTSFELPASEDISLYTRSEHKAPSGLVSEQVIAERDGKRFLDCEQKFELFFQYSGNVLYESPDPELHMMRLPGIDVLQAVTHADANFGVVYVCNPVPIEVRNTIQSALSNVVATLQQQHDTESIAHHRMRVGATALVAAAADSLITDIESVQLASVPPQPTDHSLQGACHIRAKKGSDTATQFSHLTLASTFSPVLHDNAAVTVHICIHLPDAAEEIISSTLDWLRQTALELYGERQVEAALDILDGFGDLPSCDAFDGILKIGWSKLSHGVIYGGVKLTEHPSLVRNAYNFLLESADHDGMIEKRIRLDIADEFDILSIQLKKETQAAVRASFGATITHVYFANHQGTLWFATGTEQAVEMIRQMISACCSPDAAFRQTPLFTLEADFQRWADFPQNDPAGVAQIPLWLDANEWRFPPNPLADFLGVHSTPSGKPMPLMQRVFTRGGSPAIRCHVTTNDDTMVLEYHIGLAMANYAILRSISAYEKAAEQTRFKLEQAEHTTEESWRNPN